MDGYSSDSGLSLVEHNTGDAGSDTAGVMLLECCDGNCTGIFGEDFASISRRLSAASLSSIVVVEEYRETKGVFAVRVARGNGKAQE